MVLDPKGSVQTGYTADFAIGVSVADAGTESTACKRSSTAEAPSPNATGGDRVAANASADAKAANVAAVEGPAHNGSSPEAAGIANSSTSSSQAASPACRPGAFMARALLGGLVAGSLWCSLLIDAADDYQT
eukprot:TRINITY_DN7679_c0_g1_i2.p4 TRINITY_DN7679_c0_g1~~TRINITY_DN7679_c0_g1_i2.p4  ORF type:complete len:132 (+),score=19.67 TRINITY_DN7679_c0_g1_i2:977-1372(+)